MPRNPRDFRFIEEQLRKMTFGVLSTVNPGGSLQTTGILYGVSASGRRTFASTSSPIKAT